MSDGGRERTLSNLEAIRARIGRAATRAGRAASDITLVAAAKTVAAAPIAWVVDAGVTAIGQNYVNELRAVHDAVDGVQWHYIGTLQTNTAHHVAHLADVVETATGGRATERLARRALEEGKTVGALIEVDLTGARSGARPEDVERIADAIAALEGVQLRGLMTIPPLTETAEGAREWFRRLRELRDGVRASHPEVVELSMGMSLDYPVAVEEGATMVRIGTALFGPRTP